MTTKFNGNVEFASLSIVDGYIGLGTVPISSNIAYTIESFSSAARTLDATETDAATIAASVSTLLSDLAKKGIITATGGE